MGFIGRWILDQIEKAGGMGYLIGGGLLLGSQIACLLLLVWVWDSTAPAWWGAIAATFLADSLFVAVAAAAARWDAAQRESRKWRTMHEANEDRAAGLAEEASGSARALKAAQDAAEYNKRGRDSAMKIAERYAHQEGQAFAYQESGEVVLVDYPEQAKLGPPTMIGRTPIAKPIPEEAPDGEE